MKIRNLLRFAAAGILALSFTACEDDNDSSLGASLIVTESTSGSTGGALTISQGSSLVFVWDARKGDTDMDLFSVSVTGSNSPSPIPTSLGGRNFPYDIANADDETYIDTLIFPNAGINLGVTSYSFTVTDKDGNTDNVTFTVTVEANATPMTNETNGAFFHIAGSLEGAYDLVNGTVVGASQPDASKDMENTDAAGDAFTGSWMAANSTMFVKDNSYDYANATVEAATSSFAAGTASASVSNPAVGDIYIAKLRGGSTYAVIKIVNVDPSDNTCNCGNTGKITFDFKK
ncbi:hypothetical protein [Croceimicrobium sp.]|uniref:hypothetical protein n=1 Tax=Croceimicrobium sp. TaxID=2828340 RepID=UPI003BA96E5A